MRPRPLTHPFRQAHLAIAATWLAMLAGCGPHTDATTPTPEQASPSPAAATPVLVAPERAVAALAPRSRDPRVTEALRDRLEQLARQVPGSSASIYWEDLDSGASVDVHADRPFKSASLIKLPVAIAVLDQWQREPRRRTPEREHALWQLIAESNNQAFDLLADELGGPSAVTAFCQAHGWADTEMNAYFREGNHPSGMNRTSARDQAAMLRAIDRRQLVSPQASEELWRLMLDQTHRQRIPAGIPGDAGVQVGNKTGTIHTVLHDVAIVRAPDAHYLLCILTANQHSDPAGDAYCRRISRTVWETLHGRTPGSTSGATGD